MAGEATLGDNPGVKFVPRLRGEGLSMLQWKPRFYAVLALAALGVALFGGYAGDTLSQFGW